MVTDASLRVVGKEKREGLIRVTLESIEHMPKFNTKKDYKCKY